MAVIFKIPIYNIKVKMVICKSIGDYCERNFDRDVGEPRAILFNFLKCKKDYDFLLLLHEDDLGEEIINHETFHLTYKILKFVGVKLSDNSEEAFAYLNDYIS